MTKRASVIVVGAGIGGLAATVRLAAKGHAVTVFEQLERPGGKLNVLEDAGFRFDTGPSLVTLPWVFEDLFQAAGTRLQDHLELRRLEPICRYFHPDGTQFDASADLPVMMHNLERWSPSSGEDFMAFYGHAARAWRGSRKPYLESTISSPLDFVRDGVPWADLGALVPWPTLDGLARRFFRDPRMHPFVGRYATYTGSSPYRAPGTLSSVLYSEFAFGAWYLMGGLYKLAESLEHIAKSLGVTFEYNAKVERLTLEQSRVTGVQLVNRTIQADAVICNADAAHLYTHLLPTHLDPRKGRLEPSLSGFVILLGVEGTTPHLEHHNIFFSSNYPLEFKRIFTEAVGAEDPTIYVCISSKTDPSQAPAGMENWFILVNAPPTGRVDWTREAPDYAALILEQLAKRGVDVRQRIRIQHLLTPDDLERRYGAHRGGIYGSSSNTVGSAFLRPKNRSGIPGLYLASGSAHPGGGLPLVTLSGKLAAEALEADWVGWADR